MFLIFSLLFALQAWAVRGTPLDDCECASIAPDLKAFLLFLIATIVADVWKEDSNYGWTDTGDVIRGHKALDRSITYKGYVLNMTSQRWLTDADTSRSLWWHYLVVIVPSNYNPDTARNATLWITDGDNDSPDELPTRFNYNMLIASELAMATGLITGCLFQVLRTIKAWL